MANYNQAMPTVNVPLQQNKQGFWDQLWHGTPRTAEQLYNYTPTQISGMNQALQRGLGGLDQFDFGPIEQQARTGFSQKTIPSIAERFTSLGAQNSSAFGQALGQAGAGLDETLAAMKQNYNLQRQPLFQQLMAMGLQPQFENLITPATGGFGNDLSQIFRNRGGMLFSGGQQSGGDIMSILMKLLPLLGL